VIDGFFNAKAAKATQNPQKKTGEEVIVEWFPSAVFAKLLRLLRSPLRAREAFP
jgi:hypothetical protein